MQNSKNKQSKPPLADGEGTPNVKGETVRLTIDVTKDLHRRIKIACAVKGVRMADEVRLILEANFPENTGG